MTAGEVSPCTSQDVLLLRDLEAPSKYLELLKRWLPADLL